MKIKTALLNAVVGGSQEAITILLDTIIDDKNVDDFCGGVAMIKDDSIILIWSENDDEDFSYCKHYCKIAGIWFTVEHPSIHEATILLFGDHSGGDGIITEFKFDSTWYTEQWCIVHNTSNRRGIFTI